jgi:diguanylate cyclase (GGDEF)-like protein
MLDPSPSSVDPATLPASRPHWLVAMNHRNRTGGFALLFLTLAAQMESMTGAHVLACIALGLHFLAGPQAMYLRARHAADPFRTEVAHMRLDVLGFGAWAGALGLPLWISAVLFIAGVVNLTSVLGLRGTVWAVGLFLLGMVPPAILLGHLSGHLPVPTDPLAAGLGLTSITLYLVGFSHGAYRRALALHLTRRQLREREQDLERRFDEIATLQAQLREQALRDPLTGLHNRRFLAEWLGGDSPGGAEGRAASGSARAAMLIDIDHFKRVNDTWGHAAGDQVLQAVARLLDVHGRSADVLCRYGGEEFLLVLSGREVARMRALAEDIRTAAERLRLGIGAADTVALTLSIGWACGRDDEPLAEVIARADRALYRAKAAGRNRVEPCVA